VWKVPYFQGGKKIMSTWKQWGARGSVVGWGTMLQAERSWVRFPTRLLDFFNLPNPSSRTMALGLTQASNRNE
jgi:hypothetical protein